MGKYTHYYQDSVKATLAKRQRLLHMFVVASVPLVFVLTMLVGVVLPQHSYAASYTWDGGGTTNNWSDCDNWSTNVCPVAADSVTFNATSSKDSVIDASWGGSLTGLTIASGYTGTISMARSLTMSGAYSQATGNFTAANQTLDLNSTFALSGGNFTASSGTMSVASTFNITGGGFTANGGTLVFDGAITNAIACNGATFNLVQFLHTGNTTKTVNANCSLPLGNNPVVGGDANADLNLLGTISGMGTLLMGTGINTNFLSIASTGVMSGFSGLTAGALTINGASLDFSSYSTVSTSGQYSQTGGTVTMPNGVDFNSTFVLNTGSVFNAPSGTATFANTFTINSAATFNANGGTVEFDGAGNVTCGGAAFNLVTFTFPSVSTKTIASDCTIPLGNDPTIPIRISLNGTFSGTGTLTISSGAFTLGSTAVLNGFTGLAASATTINGANLDFSSYSSVTVGGLTFNSGSLIAPSGDMNFLSGFTFASGVTFNANGGNTILKGVGTYVCNGVDFNFVRFDNTTSTGANTIDSSCTFPLGHDPTISVRLTNMNGVLSGTGKLTSATSVFGLNGQLQGFSSLQATNLVINTDASLGSIEDLQLAAITTINSTNTSFSNVQNAQLASLTVNSGGVANFGGMTSLDVNGIFTLNTGGSFTAPSTIASFGHDFTINTGSTFDANAGTILFDGGVNATISCANAVFNLVQLEAPSRTKTISSDCTLPLGHNPVIGGDFGIVLNGTLTGSGTLTKGPGLFTINAPNAFSVFDSLDIRSLVIAANQDFTGFNQPYVGSYNQNSGSVIASSTMQTGSFILNGGSFTAPSDSLSVTGNFTVAPGATFIHNNGTVSFDATSGDKYTITCNGAVFNHVVLNYGKHISVGCTLPLGDNPVMGAGRDYSVNGTLVGTGTLTAKSSVWLTSTYQLSGFTDLSFERNLRLISANLDLNNFTSTSVGWDLLIEGTSVLTAPEGELPVARSITLANTATFNPGSGTVLLTGTDQTLTGDIAFHNLTKTTSGTVTVGAGNTITTTGLLKLSRPSLVSSAPGSTWNLNMQGTTNICYVSVTDSVGVGNSIVAYQSNSYSTNPGWVFLNAACPGSGGGGGGTGGEPTSTVTNYTQAQAAATAATLTTPSTTLPPYHGLPSTLAKTVDTIPGSREALRAFLRFVGVTALVMLLAGGIFWFVATKRKHDQDEDTFDVSHWQGTRVG